MRVIEQKKPRAKSVDALSDTGWQNSWVWHYTVGATKREDMSDLQRKIIWAAIIALYVGVAYIVWLALQLKGILG